MKVDLSKTHGEVRGSVKLDPALLEHDWLRNLSGLMYSMHAGEPLSESNRSEMESLLGHELKDVRIHQTWQSGEMARRLNADAFTIGRHIFSPEDRLNAMTAESKGLLAHELSHVIQQTHPQPKEAHDVNSPSLSGVLISSSSLTSIHAPQLSIIGASTTTGNTSSAGLEAEAEYVEQAAQSAEEVNFENQSPVNEEEIADLVYRKMQMDLVTELDRIRR